MGDLKRVLSSLPDDNSDLAAAGQDVVRILEELVDRRDELSGLTDRLEEISSKSSGLMLLLEERSKSLAEATARSAEVIAELEVKNEDLESANRELARANVHAAELMGEIELKNREIQRLTITDPLTQTFNRRYLTEELPKLLKRAGRYGREISLAVADLDHFKGVNDEHGHQAGDRVLVEFARCLRKGIRQDVDWAVRHGGEEFMLVMPDTSPEGAYDAAERIRHETENIRIECEGGTVSVTASFGVATTGGDAGGGVAAAEDLIREADRCLYEAKERGRNRTVAATSAQGAGKP